jgi:hypothetical protein
LPTVEGQLDDLLVGHHLPDARIPRFHQRGARFHRDRFFELAELERDVQRGIRIHLQHDPGLHVGPEALKRGFEAVGADRQVLKDV